MKILEIKSKGFDRHTTVLQRVKARGSNCDTFSLPSGKCDLYRNSCVEMNLFLVFFRESMPSHFKFKEYCPLVFRNLRERFGIQEAQYMVSRFHSSHAGWSRYIQNTVVCRIFLLDTSVDEFFQLLWTFVDKELFRLFKQLFQALKDEFLTAEPLILFIWNIPLKRWNIEIISDWHLLSLSLAHFKQVGECENNLAFKVFTKFSGY